MGEGTTTAAAQNGGVLAHDEGEDAQRVARSPATGPHARRARDSVLRRSDLVSAQAEACALQVSGGFSLRGALAPQVLVEHFYAVTVLVILMRPNSRAESSLSSMMAFLVPSGSTFFLW